MTVPFTRDDFLSAFPVSRETVKALDHYAALLRKWTRAINLVGPKTLEDLWRRHLLDSAQLLRHLPPEPEGRARTIVDLGSGAGFPGLVLAILGAGEVHLFESDQRKSAFLREVIRETGAAAKVHAGRIEESPLFPADVVTARALAPLEKLMAYAAPFLRAGTEAHSVPAIALFHKGRSAEEELTAARQKWNMTADSFPSESDSAGKILRIQLLS